MKKKLLSLLLIVSMLVISVPNAMADTATYQADTENYQKDIDIMTSLSLFNKISAENADSAVTRAQFAAAVLDLVNVEPLDFGEFFKDVNTEHTYYREISAAAGRGLISGDNGYFYPDRQITYLEAVVMLLNALGYKPYAEMNGKYPTNYTTLPVVSDITKNTTIQNNLPVTVGLAARLLLNAGNTEILSVPSASASGVKFESGDTLFWEKHKIARSEGIFNSNSYTSVKSAQHQVKNAIKIDDFTGYLYYSGYETDYLGYYVEYYYKEKDMDNIVLYIAPDEKNDITRVDASDIAGYDEQNRTIHYNINKKSKRITLSSDISVIYNGKFTLSYIRDNSSIFDFDNGEMLLIDNNNDGKTDVISITALKSCVVSGIDLNNQIVYDKNGENTLNFLDKKIDSWILTYADGKIADLSDVEEKNVISYMISDDGKLMRGVLSKEKVEGIVDSAYTDGDESFVVIAGRTYKVSGSCLDNDTLPPVGTNAIIYLDFTGKIAAIENKMSGEDDGIVAANGYAFIIRIYFDDMEESYFFKLLTSDGTKASYKLAEKVKIDGITLKDSELRSEVSQMSDYQMIIYKMNANQEIVVIDTVAGDGVDEADRLKAFLSEPAKLAWVSATKSFGSNTTDVASKVYSKSKILLNSNTTVFKVPPKGNKQYDENQYGITTLPQSYDLSLTVNGFTYRDDSLYADVIQYVDTGNAGSIKWESPYMLITKITVGINSDDQVVKIFEGVDRNGSKTLFLSGEYDPSVSNSTHPSYDANKLKVGDFIKYSTDANGDINYVSSLYVQDEALPGMFILRSWYNSANFYGTFGYVLARDGSAVSLVESKADLVAQNLSPLKKDSLIDLEGTVLYKVTQDGRKTSIEECTGSYGAIADYKNSNRNTWIVTVGSSGKARFAVIYEK